MSLWIHVSSPVCALMGSVIHATPTPTRAEFERKRKTVPTLCGKQRARRLGVQCVNSDGTPSGSITVVWPPYVTEAAENGWTRCPECMALRPGKPNKFVPDEMRYDGTQGKPAKAAS